MKTNSVRVVAGKYKNRKLNFPNTLELRPTSDYLKETLFNWLSPYINDSICIDAFAGSGSLGIESLSRGASKVIFYEISFNALVQIKQNLQALNITNFEIYQADSIKAISKINISNSQIIIFLDPPFNKNIIPKILKNILQNNFIPRETIIYIETEKKSNLNLEGFEILKERSTANINAKLVVKNNSNF